MKKQLSVLIPALLPLSAAAFDIDGSRWAAGETVFHVDIPGDSLSGMSWSEAFEDAMAEWNEQTPFRFYLNPAYRDPCAGYTRSANVNAGFPAGGGDSYNGVDFGSTMCGNELGSGVAAVTLIQTRGGLQGFGHLAQTDIIFNSAMEWDVYSGRLRRGLDFRRTALHELGHAIGLGHEESQASIMAPRVGQIDSLQLDDIAAANALYGGPSDCEVADLRLNSMVDGSLQTGDCTVQELYNGGKDTSYVDAYRLQLDRKTDLTLSMESASLDSVLLVTDKRLSGVDFDDDSGGDCNARLSGTFPAGEYLVLANTYDVPQKCGGNTGSYRITVRGGDSSLPLLGNARNLTGSSVDVVFSGGASRDGGLNYDDSFSPAESISVYGDILVSPAHVGANADLYVVAVLADGRRFAKGRDGQFRRVTGGVADLPVYKDGIQLKASESIDVISNFVPGNIGIADMDFAIYIGYSPVGTSEIYYNGEAIRFTVE